jgi:AbrB family looped-hinge helix DNA binding protein
MPFTTLTANGQLTLPKSVRDRLALKQGDRLQIAVERGGRLTIERVKPASLDAVVGLLGHLARPRPVSLAVMRAAVRRRAKQKARG